MFRLQSLQSLRAEVSGCVLHVFFYVRVCVCFFFWRGGGWLGLRALTEFWCLDIGFQRFSMSKLKLKSLSPTC